MRLIGALLTCSAPQTEPKNKHVSSLFRSSKLDPLLNEVVQVDSNAHIASTSSPEAVTGTFESELQPALSGPDHVGRINGDVPDYHYRQQQVPSQVDGIAQQVNEEVDDAPINSFLRKPFSMRSIWPFR